MSGQKNVPQRAGTAPLSPIRSQIQSGIVGHVLERGSFSLFMWGVCCLNAELLKDLLP